MATKTNSTEVIALKLAVEKRFGHKPETRTDFSQLADIIEATTHEHLAENTLRRLWGRIHGYDTVFTRTLDVLSCYVDCEHFQGFCQQLQHADNRESEIISEGISINANQLTPGDLIRIGWLPDRECIVEFIGGRMFKAVATKNSTMQKGDTFECSIMIKNYPLFIDNLVHGGEHCARYSIGLDNGLSILEKL